MMTSSGIVARAGIPMKGATVRFMERERTNDENAR
jgi:hypothetical protein